ncbi:beta-N-acetylhexosaminidase [Bacillus sp. 1P02SD]|uniref:beta-N-acetylhexosaminidase n=1 Tax=Bacillus sp. 1P02SD TaxID=3132264 RepID=UPI00399FE2B4
MHKKKLRLGMIGLLSVVLVIGLGYFIFYKDQSQESEQTEPSEEIVQPNGSDEIEKEPEEKPEESLDTIERVKEVFSLAKTGKVPQTSFIAGQTKYDEIQDQWGKPQTMDATTIGDFAVYPDHDVTIGIKNQLAFDIRSYDPGLRDIHFEDIKNAMDEPDEIKYFQDEKVNQIILIYQVSPTFQLKWILPKPTEQEPNPIVHHISVVTDVQQSVDEDESLSLDKKIGQMIFAGITGTKMNSKMNELVANYHVGGIIFNGDNLESPNQTVTYVNQIKKANESDIPLFFGVDQEGGRISKLPGGLLDFPTNLEIGKRNNPSLSFEIGTLLGKELQAFGFNVDFAPVLDVNSNPDNPVIGDRSFSSNPDIVSSLGIQTMKGLQSQSIVSVVKHFPGHGDTRADSHLELPKVNKTRAELESLELIPFREAVEEGADMVMIAHILVPSHDQTFPSSMSKKIMTDLLRNDLGFKGVIITDDLTMKAITNEYDIGAAAVQSIKAGSDIVMVAHNYQHVVAVRNAIKKAVINGEISEQRIDESVGRILQLKEKYKLSDSPVGPVKIDVLNQAIEQVLSR